VFTVDSVESGVQAFQQHTVLDLVFCACLVRSFCCAVSAAQQVFFLYNIRVIKQGNMSSNIAKIKRVHVLSSATHTGHI